MPIRSLVKTAATLLLVLAVLTGCKVELYTKLNENEANDMLAALLQNGIDADKVTVKDQLANIEVDKADVARAINLLRSKGLPREKFASIGEIFKQEGLISTPAEERARYIYALSQELARTLLGIDGVTAARVHLVLPENDPRKNHSLPSSAAVLIKHNEDQLVGNLVPQIKELVTNSIEGLSYDKVSVVLIENQTFESESSAPAYANVLGMWVDPQSASAIWTIVGALVLMLLALAGGGGYLLFSHLRANGGRQHGS